MTKEEIQKLVEIPGKVRGQALITDIEYISGRFGQEGSDSLKNKIKEWGGLFDYEKVKIMGWYPVGFRVLSLLAAKDAFLWSDREIFEMGNNAPKYSFIVKLLMKYFLTPLKTFKESSKYWEKHYSVGDLGYIDFDKKKKQGAIYLKNFKIHPVLCAFYRGYFSRIAQYVLKSDRINIEEIKCAFSGDAHHEFLVKW